MKTIKVLFVCMGNICRSPTAEGVFRKKVENAGLADRILIDSAGTHAYHVGSAPDPRAQRAALKRDIDLSRLRGRRVEHTDFIEFDYILAMDDSNYHDLLDECPAGYEARVRRFLEFGSRGQTEVPDPYYGSGNGFEIVLDLIEDAADGLLEALKKTRD